MRLVIALGLVVVLMGQLRGPRGAKVLGIFFGGPDAGERPKDQGEMVTPIRPAEERLGASEDANLLSPSNRGMGRRAALSRENGLETQDDLSSPRIDGLEHVKDNAAFRGEDAGPWFQLLGVLHAATQAGLQSHSLGELTPLQLLEQPEAYRGRLVTLRGIVRQSLALDPLRAASNTRDMARLSLFPEIEFPVRALRTFLTASLLSDYHRVTIQQPGASVPVVVFTLDVPDGFPEGESLHEPVSVTGYFFKNWLYSTGDGLSIGPVLLAKRIGWQKNGPPVPALPQADGRDVLVTVCAAALLGAVATWWLWRRSRSLAVTRRGKPSPHIPTPDFSFARRPPQPGGETCGEPS